MKKQLLSSCKLYLVLDREIYDYQKLLKIAAQALKGGVDIIQLRDKKGVARDVLEFSRQLKKIAQGKVPYIINDRVDLALAAGASGVHLGQEDLSVALARNILGKKAIIGVSCQTKEAVLQAQRAQADYIGFGSIFKTLTKPYRQPMDLNLLADVYHSSKIPLFAIGGIGLNNISVLKGKGINHVAICRNICLAKDILKTTFQLKNILLS